LLGIQRTVPNGKVVEKMKTLSQTFRSIKRPIQNPKLSNSSSSPSKSELKINAKPKSESWCVYLILSTNHPIKTYVGVTTNFPRR
jgi:structure-specific endonuclease subunit SLX1